ncbi:hypothetical protein KR059_005947 [Drosophila kikkawai]|nr:hypothetical protein KR059_005947 [Drosophila kikkawai]
MAAKKPKMTSDKDNGNDVSITCSYWVPRKKRRCKMTANKGSPFCGAHAPPSVAPENVDGTGEDSFQERIPCPLDPKHTVFKRKLAKHLTICNARDQESSLPYIVKGINSGEDQLEAVGKYDQIKLHELSDDEFYGLIDKVKQLYDKHINSSIQELQLSHESLKAELSRSVYGQETLRQLTQASSLLGILEKDDQLVDGTSYVEFGAGKGQLAFFLATVLEDQKLTRSQVILVDRLSLRHKKDNKLTNKEQVQRIRADIADLKLCALPELKKTQRTVALSKHLCGAATDLTLRCILGKEGGAATDYVLIALCCHHRCSWSSYVGRSFLQAAGIEAREFTILTKMVSWAVCGTGMSRERRRAMEKAEEQPAEPNTQRLSREEREKIGQQCKRILDYGRLEYLRSQGYQAELKFYVPRDVTLENVVLLARRSTSVPQSKNIS